MSRSARGTYSLRETVVRPAQLLAGPASRPAPVAHPPASGNETLRPRQSLPSDHPGPAEDRWQESAPTIRRHPTPIRRPQWKKSPRPESSNPWPTRQAFAPRPAARSNPWPDGSRPATAAQTHHRLQPHRESRGQSPQARVPTSMRVGPADGSRPPWQWVRSRSDLRRWAMDWCPDCPWATPTIAARMAGGTHPPARPPSGMPKCRRTPAGASWRTATRNPRYTDRLPVTTIARTSQTRRCPTNHRGAAIGPLGTARAAPGDQSFRPVGLSAARAGAARNRADPAAETRWSCLRRWPWSAPRRLTLSMPSRHGWTT